VGTVCAALLLTTVASAAVDASGAGDAGRGLPIRRAGATSVTSAFGAEHGWGNPAAGPALNVGVSAQTQQPAAKPPATPRPPTPAQPPQMPPSAQVPTGYVIGPDDVLAIVFWRDKDMSAEVTVRPDGKITLPLINEVQAAGLTPEQLRDTLQQAATKFLEDPTVSVVVKTINSRKVFITGQVAKPGAYSLSAPTTVMQLIAMAGGLLEFADSKNITIIRNENGKPTAYRFNYKDVLKHKNLKQNIELKPGDTVVVP
jgi:polysaccharide export outer membrane protein